MGDHLGIPNNLGFVGIKIKWIELRELHLGMIETGATMKFCRVAFMLSYNNIAIRDPEHDNYRE